MPHRRDGSGPGRAGVHRTVNRRGSLLESVLDLLAGLLEFPLAWSALPSACICSLPIAAPVSLLTLPLTSVTLFAALFSADIGDARRPAASPPGASRLGYLPRGPLPVVGAEVVLLQRDGLTSALAERVARGLLVRGRRVHRRPGVLGRLHPDAPVAGHPRAGRDELADDDVLLEAEQRVRLGVDGRVGEYPRRLLEGGRRQPRVGSQRRLGDAHEHRPPRRWGAALLHHRAVDILEPRPFNELAGEQVGVTGLEDVHPL